MEQQQQKRFVLAMLICAGIVLAWQYFFAPPPPTPEQQAAKQTATAQQEQPSSEQTAETKGAGQEADGAGEAGASTGPEAAPTPKKVPVVTHTLDTDRFDIELSNAGGRVTGITFDDPDQYSHAGNLLGSFPKDSTRYPFGLSFDKGSILLPEGVVYEVAEADEAHVSYRYVDPKGRFKITKTYRLHEKHPYTLDFDVAIENLTEGSLVDQMSLTITGYKDPKEESSFLDFRPDEIETICRLEGDTERELYSAHEANDPHRYATKTLWGAVNTRYFLWGVVPDKAAESCAMVIDGGYLKTTLTWDDFSIAPGSTYTYEQTLYAGPKDVDIFSEVHADLTESVDYGILTILAKPMRWLLNLFQSWVGNWGLAIILLTLLIKLGTWPFTEKSYANAERMKEIQPQLDALREKHENDQQRLAEETMKLFKENSFNPLGGCFPMLLQMPILYALYVMIINSVELYHADFILWYTDLSARDPYFVLPILMGVMMLIQQKFMTTSTNNQQAAVMMKVMPVMFTAFMLFLPAGLVLYYSLNLVLGVFQQWLIRRKFARKREAAAAG